MLRAAELLAFGAAAAGLHLALLAGVDAPTGGAPADAGAPASLAVAAPDAGLRELVEAWRAPPDAATAPREPTPPRSAAAPAGAGAGGPPVVPAAPSGLGDAPEPEVAPQRDAPPEPARPRPRPESISPPARPAPASPGSAGRAAARAPVPAPAGPAEATLRRTLAAEVRAAIAGAQRYPARAAERGVAGAPTLRLTISRDGALLGAAVTASSGSALLDRAAVAAARDVGRYPAAPEGLRGGSFTFEVRLVYDLR